MVKFLIFFLAFSSVTGFKDPHCAPGHAGIVHLFEWKWTDIARECREFLGPRKFCGIQVSPANEHAIIDRPSYNPNIRFPWYQRYQPVSYKLNSRSGNEQQFRSMVETCNGAGVRIYVDILPNHMAADASRGTGSGGCKNDPLGLNYPCVPFGALDFNSCEKCGTQSCNVENYQDKFQIRNCRLVGLPDLDQSKPYVRTKIRDFLKHMMSIGVAGFRVDAAKHMWPGDLQVIYNSLGNLNGKYFGNGAKPFIYQEVIDLGGEPISKNEYNHMGQVTEFKYSTYIGQMFLGKNQLTHLKTFGPSWGMQASGDAFVFVDNHDNQRGHGPGGSDIITSYQGNKYARAVAFMMAWPYGTPRIMSSYRWDGGPSSNDWIGPPTDDNGNTYSVSINSQQQCNDRWVCEHRWPAIRGMGQWAGIAGSSPVQNWWSNGGNQIAFSRGGNAFIAINNEGAGLKATLSTGLPSGTYCNVATGTYSNDKCIGGETITVYSNGKASIDISSGHSTGIVAIHKNSRIGGGGNVQTPKPTTGGGGGSTSKPTSGPSVGGWQRTVVLIKKQTSQGQWVFLRGGACQGGSCNVPIRYTKEYTGQHFNSYNAWRVGDTTLGWFGKDSNQGSFTGRQADGSPTFWSSSSQGQIPENTYGDHYWAWDVEMDCDKTSKGWFEVKGYLNGWEHDINQSKCNGWSSKPSFKSGNHVARCGKVNVFTWGSGDCTIQ